MSLHIGDVGIDYSGARPAMSAIKAAHGKFVLRYSAGMGNSARNAQWKLCEPHEIRDAVAAGMDFIANSEWYESRITEGGGAGQQDGGADLVFWKSRGLAKGASIYVSWDQAPARLKWGAALRYLQAYNKALAGYYHVDCYAGTQFLRYALSKGVIRYGWRTNAGSWSNDGLPYQPTMSAAMIAHGQAATPAHIWQNGNYWFNKQADENVILRTPVGSHLDALAAARPSPKPSPKPATPGLYPAGVGNARSLVDPTRHVQYIPTADGRIEVRKDHKHLGYIVPQKG